MIIACPACSTKFNVDGSKLSASGTRVRCASCSHVWLQSPDGPVAAPPPAPKKPAAPPPPPVAEAEPPRATPQRLIEPKTVQKPPQPVGSEPVEVEAEDTPAPPPAVRGAPPPPPPKQPQGAPPGFKSAGRKPEGDRFSAPSAVRPPAPVASDVKPARGKPLRETVTPAIPADTSEPKRKRGGAFLIILLGFLILLGAAAGAAYAFREDIVRNWPEAAWAFEQVGVKVETIPISFRNVTNTRLFEDGVPTLEVRGELHNDRDETVVIPRLRAALKDSHDQELYHWFFNADAQKLGPRQATTFSTRLSSPPVEARDLEVRFVYGNE